jgi:Domain of unknown function (DUF4157)
MRLNGGAPLHAPVQRRLEKSFGADFRGVRVHSDMGAALTADRLGARAFTFGPHIFLGPSGRADDLGLMAHEAAHVVQQRGAEAPAPPAWSGSGGDRFEHEAQSAAAAVTRSEAFAVRERTDRPRVQRFGISNILDKLAGMANGIPGFRMFTIVLGVNPINMSAVPRTAANILRAAVEIIPGGALITAALDGYGIFDKIGAWVEQQINSLGMVGSAIRAGLMKFIDSIELTDLVPWNLGKLADKALDTLTAPVKQVWNFVVGLGADILNFIKDALLVPVAKLAEGTRGYDLLKAIIGKDPVTGDPVPRSAETLIPGFLKLIGEEETWQNMQKANAIPRVWAWFQGAVDSVLGFVKEFPALVVSTVKSITLSDVFPPTGVLAKVGSAFGDFIGRFISWIGTALWTLLELIFEVVSPQALAYIKKVGAAFKKILKDPMPFVGNLVKAAKAGFVNFGDNILTHLKNSLIDWLTGSLPGIYIPKAFSLVEILKFVLSIMGLSWENIRQKIVKVIGEPAMKVLETTFDIVVKLVREGPAAAWAEIKTQLANLQDMAIGAITDLVIDTIVKKAVPKLIAMFIPGAGFISAIISIYDTIKSFIEKIKKIVAAVTAFVDSIVEIAEGAIGNAANKVESGLANGLTFFIGILAGFLGLGGIPDKVAGAVNKYIRGPIDKALDWLVGWIVAGAKKLGKLAVQAGVPQDPDKRVQLGADAAVKAVNALSGPSVTVALINPVLSAIKLRYGLKMLVPVDTGGEWWVEADINPKSRKRTSKKSRATGAPGAPTPPGGAPATAGRPSQLKIATVRPKDPATLTKLEVAAATSGRAWQDAVNVAVVKEILVPKWELVLQVPIEILVRGQKAFTYPSRTDLARLKIDRGHRAGRAGVEPDVTMEVREPKGTDVKEVRVVEITLVEDFTAAGDFAEHKIQQFTSDIMIFKEKYGPDMPVKYYFAAPRPPTPATKAFILDTLRSQGATKVTVIWLIVATK